MSEHGHGPSWYKVLLAGIGVTYLVFLTMLAGCSFSLNDPLSLFNTFLCVLYVGFAALCFIVGVVLSLVGLEHAKHDSKRKFYIFSIIYFLSGMAGIVLYKFF